MLPRFLLLPCLFALTLAVFAQADDSLAARIERQRRLAVDWAGLSVCDCFTKQTTLRPQGKIIGFNGSIESLALESGSVVSRLLFGPRCRPRFQKELTIDGVLPKPAGQAVMAPLTKRVIAGALIRK